MGGLHDLRSHLAVAAASGNPLPGALVELVSVLVYDRRRLTIERARDLEESAETLKRVFAAIRQRNAERARREMEYHLDAARLNPLLEEDEPACGMLPGSPRRSVAKRRRRA